ncbi:HD family phosphohydrolase [Lysinibacillus sp. 54212]|uniref:HD family phosphohydrolase n=1 Tax=Lysinibacillus sp. 54212 TaxID=3119829 RepID=UPI002FC6648D
MRKQIKRFIDVIGFRSFLMIVLLITASVQFLLMLDNVKGVTYDISMGSLAPETIRAAKTVEDTEKTEREREAAGEAIQPIYDYNTEIAQQRTSFVSLIFDLAIEAQEEIQKDEKLTKSDELQIIQKKLKDVYESQDNFKLTDGQLLQLINTPSEDLLLTRDFVAQSVKVMLQEPIRKAEVEEQQKSIENIIKMNEKVPQSLEETATVIGRTAIVENEKVNVEKTELAKKQAIEAVEPTKILQGQIIVQEGEMVEQEIYRQLQLLGLIDNQSSLKPVVGLIILIFLQMSFIFMLFDRSKSKLSIKRNGLLVTVIIYIASLFIMKLTSIVAQDFDVMVAFIYPTAMATMLVRLLANDRAAIVVTLLCSASAGLMFQESYAAILQMDIALYILFGGFASLFFMRSVEKRAHLLQASGVITVINLMFITFYLLMTQSGYGLAEISFYVGAAVISGILSGALTMGLLPFFESMFGILSTMRLIELSNPNHPLLKKILTEAPGTYHHSVMVANLAEAACEAIGADGLLARVGCYYHDVGKTRRPAFFIENQMSGINPHDSLPPESSAEIIIAHTTDGAEMLRKHKMPQEIIDIALQHHGTSLLKFFLHKAREEGKELDEAQFRYPGPKPQTKEAAIISIADSVEAAVRSMKAPNAEKIQKLIQSIIQDRVKDDQFDECDVSLKELKKIEDVLCKTLNGIFHSRIEYPDEKA